MAPSCQDRPTFTETFSCLFRVALIFATVRYSPPSASQGTGMMMDSELTPLKRSACTRRVVRTGSAHPLQDALQDAPFASVFSERASEVLVPLRDAANLQLT